MKTRLFIILIFIFFSIKLLQAQKAKFYLQIIDKDIVPKKETLKDVKSTKIFKSNNTNLNAVLNKYNIEYFEQAFPTAPTEFLQQIYLVDCDNKKLGEELNEKFKDQMPLVEYLVEPQLLFEPNDYGKVIPQTNLDLIRAKEAFDLAKDIPKITVAITDTYFDVNHEDIFNITGVRGSNSYIDFHGTCVMGLVGENSNNNIGLSAIGYNTPIYLSTNRTDNEVLLLAQAGYRVINCSWLNSCSFNTTQDILYNTIKNTYNTVVVFGAGNNSKVDHCGSLTAKVYPASYESVLSVTSIGHEHPYGSGFTSGVADVFRDILIDPTSSHHYNDAVDLCAPGYKVPTTDIMGSGGVSEGNYTVAWGTSFAAPQVSGTLAIMFSVNPALTADQAMGIIKFTADASIYNKPENQPYLGLIGSGRLDAYCAVYHSQPLALNGVQSGSFSRYLINLVNGSILNVQSLTLNAAEISITGTFDAPVGTNLNLIPTTHFTCN